MYFLYNIVVLIVEFLLKGIGLFNQKISLFLKGRSETFIKLEQALSSSDRTLWVHCASLGEFEQGRPIIENIKIKFPNHKIVLTFFSPSGYEVRKNFKDVDVVCYLPIDSISNARKFVELVQPEIAIFVKYEFWPNLLKVLKENKVKTILVSGIFRREQIFFKWFGSWMKNSLNSFSYFFVQDENSKKLLNSIGIENVELSGDTRFDRVYSIKEQNNHLDFMTDFKQNRTMFIAGSTWKEDESFIVDFINRCELDGVKFAIAPHNINPIEIEKLKKSINKETILYSEVGKGELATAKVMIIDTIGLLTKIYSYADVTYVGGGFATGLHNVLEPATFGKPIIIGPEYDKFNEAKELVNQKGCISIQGYDEFEKVVNDLLLDTKFRSEKGKITSDYVTSNIGATSMIIEYVSNKIEV